MNRAKEQLDRIKRWHKKFEEINSGKPIDRESDYDEDIVYAFFQNCWHLKDWIIYSNLLDRNIVDSFTESNLDLKICRDLANGSKHLKIEKPSIDPNTRIYRREFSITISGEPVIIKTRYIVHSGGRIIDAFDLATTCISHWEAFLSIHSLN